MHMYGHTWGREGPFPLVVISGVGGHVGTLVLMGALMGVSMSHVEFKKSQSPIRPAATGLPWRGGHYFLTNNALAGILISIYMLIYLLYLHLCVTPI